MALTGRERQRLVEMELVKRGRSTLEQASGRLGVSYRQVKRIWQRYREGGARGLVHGGRGRASNRARVEDRRRCLEMYGEKLEGFGPTLAAEKLAEMGVRVDHETLRRWLMNEGLWKKRRKRGPHRKWRPRREHFGELVQMDGSFHDWFSRGDRPCLIDLVDDATGVMWGRFEAEETSAGAMRALREWIERYGIPRALYTDRKNVYVTDREATPEEQLAGEPALTAFGKACFKLGIEIIPASSPQAKGRIERRHGVLQDRLVKELKLRGIQDLDVGNGLLHEGFLERINESFRHEPANGVDYHRPVPPSMKFEDVFVFDDKRIVQNDWTISWQGRFFQITGPSAWLPRPRRPVTVRRGLDGSFRLLNREKMLDFVELPGRPRRAEVLSSKTHQPWVPPSSHPWRRPLNAAGAERNRRLVSTTAG